MPARQARPSATASRSSFSTGKVSARVNDCHARFMVAHASRVLVLASRQNDLLIEFICNRESEFTRKVRDREDALANTREACATQSDLPLETAASTIAGMLDIRFIREKPNFVRERLATRASGDEAKIDEVLRVDAERRKVETALQQLNADRKRLSKEIGGKKSRGETTDEAERRVRQIGEQIAELNARATAAEDEQNNLLLRIANLPHESVPIGKDPSANRVVRSWGEKPRLAEPSDQVALGTRLNLFNPELAAKLSGSGLICFTGAGAKLERALINFMIDLHTREHGYVEIRSPFLVRRDCMIGTSQLPK